MFHELLLSDSYGIYIPREFVLWYSDAFTTDNPERYRKELDILRGGPEEEWYWESWSYITDNAYCVQEKHQGWKLYQNGDLWMYHPEHGEEVFGE